MLEREQRGSWGIWAYRATLPCRAPRNYIFIAVRIAIMLRSGRVAGRAGCHRDSPRLCFNAWRRARGAARRWGVPLRASSTDVAASGDSPAFEPVQPLLLAWFSSKNESVFAAQCLVETVIHHVLAGGTFNELKMSLQLANMGSQPQLLHPMEEDILTSWLALICLALSELGLSMPDGSGRVADPAGPAEQRSAYLKGMGAYVAQTMALYDSGTTLAAITGLQRVVREDGDGSQRSTSGFVALMQQVRTQVPSQPCTVPPPGCALAAVQHLDALLGHHALAAHDWPAHD